MLIEDYFNNQEGKVCFTREHASNFAKQIAGDFNPLHDTDSKRFCVPGDLLFSIILSKYGLSQHMEFGFLGMVVDGVELNFPAPSPHLLISDSNGKEYLSAERTGENSMDSSLIRNLTRSYVGFSGHTFPHLLVPLMQKNKVMINPDRPMVIYQSMTIDLDTLAIKEPTLEIDRTELELVGKRGNVLFAFNIIEAGKIVGRGRKHMILSGLREYDQSSIDKVIELYAQRKNEFLT